MCLSNTVLATLVISNLADFRKKTLKALCGSESSCKRASSVYSSVDNIIINAYNATKTEEKFTLTIQPEEFIYFDSQEQAQLLMFDITDPRANMPNICGADATFAIGAMAMGKREIVIRY